MVSSLKQSTSQLNRTFIFEPTVQTDRHSDKHIKDILIQLNPAFDHRNRLGIMSVLAVNEWVDYNTLKELLQLTDGNLASHLKPLEAQGYIEFKKQFIGRRPQTTYAATEKGRQAFTAHLDALEMMVKMGREIED